MLKVFVWAVLVLILTTVPSFMVVRADVIGVPEQGIKGRKAIPVNVEVVQNGGQVDFKYDLAGGIPAFQGQSKRRKKSPAGFLARAAYAGAVAVKKLVADAQKLPSRNRCCQDYKKIGSFKEAEQDFDKLNPQDVRRFQFPDGVQAKSGEIGDRTLLVRSAGIYGDPVLEIINRKTYNRGPLEWSLSDEPPIHRITYSRKLTED